jgi:ATP-dependent DNA helicase Q1
MALSATCPPRVLKDLLQILRMKDVTDGKGALSELFECEVLNLTSCQYGWHCLFHCTTISYVIFSHPYTQAHGLEGKNLHYKVLIKPSAAAAAIQAMSDYILQYHTEDTGIVYCLSKKVRLTFISGTVT